MYMKYKKLVPGLFILIFFFIQVLGILAGRFTESKFFCWAPFDEISLFVIETEVNGKMLTPDEIRARYRIRPQGRENRSIHNVISIVRQYEDTYGSGELVVVKISYKINGHKKGTWYWPENKIYHQI